SALTIFLLLFYRNRKLKRINHILSEQNRIITDQKQELADLYALKDRFYSIIAHDLRGPFNGILGLSDVLAEELRPDPELSKLAQNLHSSALGLYSLLENLLQWAQFQQGSMPFKPERLHLGSLIRQSLEINRVMTTKKEIRFLLETPADLFAFADRSMVEVVIRILISNAIKFISSAGEIQILAKKNDRDVVEVSIIDSGIGMSEAMISNLFMMNKSNNRKGTNGEPSSGLGLIISKEFIEKNGGTITVKSDQGKGSRFTFTLPAN
ncbi:MAG: HAMP domain-containing sensor histidine kinase, partial [Bacteroidales bacterium]|nr:HAMP domain-containing sensor histidine kinase [Bacteroidales bacterium]